MSVLTPKDNDCIAFVMLTNITNQLEHLAKIMAHGSCPTAEQAIKLGSSTGRLLELKKEIGELIK